MGRAETIGDGELISEGNSPSQGKAARLAEVQFTTLHTLYARSLFNFALRLSGDRERSEEVVQDALMRAWQRSEVVSSPQAPARAWLFTVVRNGMTDSWRRDAVRPRTGGSEHLDSLGEPDKVELAVEAWVVADALHRLTLAHHQVLWHRYYLGHSAEETAAALRLPVGTIKSRTHYALRSLRLTLEETGYVR